jgi:hypothetical protein
VTKRDRLGRSVKHLVDLGLSRHDRSIDLVVTQQGIDTTTPTCKLFVPPACRDRRTRNGPDLTAHEGRPCSDTDLGRNGATCRR